MRGPTILFFLFLFFVSFQHGNAQQVNPFELKEGNEKKIENQETDSNIDTGNFNVTLIEDSLKKPEIVEEIISTQEAIVNTNEVEAPAQAIVEDTPSNSNPFDLINDTLSGSETSIDTLSEEIEIDTINESSSAISDTSNISEIPVIEEVKNIMKPPVPKERNLFVLWASLFCGLLIAISINSKRNLLNEILKSFRNLSYMKLLQKEQKNGWSIPYILFYVVFLINICIFIRFVCIHYEIPVLQYSYIKIGVAILGLLALRHLSLYIISFMRKRLNEAMQYNFIIISSHIITGLVLIPINLFIAFASPNIAVFILYFGIGFIALAFLSRWFRAFINSLRLILGHSFHFLLYLCSCEIVPVIILIGYLRNLIG